MKILSQQLFQKLILRRLKLKLSKHLIIKKADKLVILIKDFINYLFYSYFKR